MENVPPVPPLFCSTPPPIDFGEDDDEFGDFALAADTEDIKNFDVPSIQEFENLESRLDDGCFIPNYSPPPLDSNCTNEEPVEAINLSLTKKVQEGISVTTNSHIIVDKVSECCNNAANSIENLNHSKDERISLYNNNNCLYPIEHSNSSILNEEVSEVNTNNLPSTCGVTLEDVSDDSSDDEYIRKKCDGTKFEENADDFFSIHFINENNVHSNTTPEILRTENLKTSSTESIHEPIGSLNIENSLEFCSQGGFNNLKSLDNTSEIKGIEVDKEDSFFNADFSEFNSKLSFEVTNTQIDNKLFHDDEDDICMDLKSVHESLKDIEKVENSDECIALNEQINEFDKHLEQIPGNNIVSEEDDDDDDDNDDNDDDDEDFGEFAVVTPKLPPSIPVDVCAVMPTNQINERLLPILEMMFPNNESHNSKNSATILATEAYANLSRLLQIDSVDSAKALSYQWKNSQVRNSLIKSLGIDSRNILYGEKWNATMPRFAANLSFNPLKPVKSQHGTPSQTDLVYKTDNQLPDFDLNAVKESKEEENEREVKDIAMFELGDTHICNDLQISHTVEGRHLDNISENTLSNTEITFDTAMATTTPSLEKEGTERICASLEADNRSNIPIPIYNHLNYQTTDGGNIYVAANNTNSAKLDHIENHNHISMREKAISKSVISLKLNEDEVMTTSTYAGPLKETHIFTPSKSDDAVVSVTTGQSSRGVLAKSLKTEPIDFDYEKAAAGIIINETVVKKEYRDVEYNPGFSLGFSNNNGLNEKLPETVFELRDETNITTVPHGELNRKDQHNKCMNETEDEFSDFQSVLPTTNTAVSPSHWSSTLPPESIIKTKATVSRAVTSTVSNEMILSPAILLPKSIHMSNSKPRVEWGDTAGSINPEELARIEELFPQPQTTPIHNVVTKQQSPTISAKIAQEEKDSGSNHTIGDDDDDWSEFLSVPVSTSNDSLHIKQHYTKSNPHIHSKIQSTSTSSIQHKGSPIKNVVDSYQSSVEDEWSDFVSSTPAPNEQLSTKSNGVSAWQEPVLYQNPLNLYHPYKDNIMPNRGQFYSNKSYSNIQLQNPPTHIVHDFSTAPPQSSSKQGHSSANNINNFGPIGFETKKVAPNISFIPTLGFSNTLPKYSFNAKK